MGKKKKTESNYQFAIEVADGFYQTGLSLAKHSHEAHYDRGYIWIPPGVVNFSFATELLLKATIFYDLKQKPWGHKLYRLYQSLSEKTKQKIETSYKQYKKANEKVDSLPAYKITIRVGDDNTDHSKETNFDEIKNLLEIHSDSFENWRYIHEFGQEGYCYEFDFKAMDAFYKALVDALKALLKNEKASFGMKLA
jgi:HEPN domain.